MSQHMMQLAGGGIVAFNEGMKSLRQKKMGCLVCLVCLTTPYVALKNEEKPKELGL